MQACSPRRSSAAFTLIELMIVIGLVLLMTALLVPTFSSLTRTKSVTGAMNDVSEMIDMARTNAMAKSTYVWLGFYNATVNGQSQLWVAGLRSLDGTPNINTPNNTRLIGKVQKFDNIVVTTSAPVVPTLPGLTSAVKAMMDAGNVTKSNGGASEIADSSLGLTTGVSVSVNGSNTTFTQFITFTPQGQSVVTNNPSTALPPTPFTTQITIGLRRMAGTSKVTSDVDSVGLVLYGGTGQIRLFRM
jgi:type II secretory pathway pseudopilin PulG